MGIKTETFHTLYLSEVSKIEKRLINTYKGKPTSLATKCSYILYGDGKRLRPFLVLISAKAVGGNFRGVYNAAISVELLHNFSLIHDDIMDSARKRRGKMTLHVKYDVGSAILTGDALFALAYENLLKDCTTHTKEVISIFTQCAVSLSEGQSLDSEFESRQQISIPEYKNMIYKKTAVFLEMCCTLGALLSGASREQTKAVSNYGKFLGMAFQIQDDLLDIIGKEKKFGKTIGSDLIQKKKTYLFLQALKKATNKEKKILLSIMRQKEISKSEIDICKKLYLKLGVIKDAKREITKYTDAAFKSLHPLPDNEGKELLFWLAKILLSREH